MVFIWDDKCPTQATHLGAYNRLLELEVPRCKSVRIGLLHYLHDFAKLCPTLFHDLRPAGIDSDSSISMRVWSSLLVLAKCLPQRQADPGADLSLKVPVSMPSIDHILHLFRSLLQRRCEDTKVPQYSDRRLDWRPSQAHLVSLPRSCTRLFASCEAKRHRQWREERSIRLPPGDLVGRWCDCPHAPKSSGGSSTTQGCSAPGCSECLYLDLRSVATFAFVHLFAHVSALSCVEGRQPSHGWNARVRR